MKKNLQHTASDILVSIVVLLIGLPLCLGIALGSGAPLFSGIIAGIVGGIVVGFLSGSQLSVSGPAAALTGIVVVGISNLGSFEAFLVSVVLAGVFQLIFGYLKAGVIAHYVPNSVIKGMVMAIGLILILKQVPHFLGYDADFEGDEGFLQNDQHNTFTEISYAFTSINTSAFIIGLISLFTLLIWQSKLVKKNNFSMGLPGPLLVVLIALSLTYFLPFFGSEFILAPSHLVNLPIAKSFTDFFTFFTLPQFNHITNPSVWVTAFSLAVIASLETLLAIEAVDKLDPLKRITPTNQELKAQGIGNILSGLIGGLPLASVIIRSSVNVKSGAKSKFSTIFNGILLLFCVIFIPAVLSKIPLSALAAVLLYTGFQLVNFNEIKAIYAKGLDQFMPFLATVLSILFTDMLTGIVIGILVSLFYLVRSNFRSAILVASDNNNFLIRLRKDVSFLNKPIVKKHLESFPPNSNVIIDATRADFIDKDIIEEINDFISIAPSRGISVSIKKGNYQPTHLLFKQP
ncbi:SulP family inorganic anion transporter [Sediminibacterium sp.]|uniref:SulP family inorganic anion transporter n=1 Tax=Sediminibacterium sp. TaxID=1917865 RepID=UPI003F72720A